MLSEKDTEYLNAAMPFLKRCPDGEPQKIALSAEKKNFSAGAILQNKGNGCNGVVVVKSGQLRAFYESEDGKEITLYRLLSGDVCILTANCTLKNITFEITLEAEKTSVVIMIPANVWSETAENNEDIRKFSMDLVMQRFSEVMWVMEQMVSKNMGQRIAAFLMEQYVLEDNKSLALTHEIIAKNLGTAREVVSRILKYLENDGLIRLSRGKIELVDLQKLKKLSD